MWEEVEVEAVKEVAVALSIGRCTKGAAAALRASNPGEELTLLNKVSPPLMLLP